VQLIVLSSIEPKEEKSGGKKRKEEGKLGNLRGFYETDISRRENILRLHMFLRSCHLSFYFISHQ